MPIALARKLFRRCETRAKFFNTTLTVTQQPGQDAVTREKPNQTVVIDAAQIRCCSLVMLTPATLSKDSVLLILICVRTNRFDFLSDSLGEFSGEAATSTVGAVPAFGKKKAGEVHLPLGSWSTEFLGRWSPARAGHHPGAIKFIVESIRHNDLISNTGISTQTKALI